MAIKRKGNKIEFTGKDARDFARAVLPSMRGKEDVQNISKELITDKNVEFLLNDTRPRRSPNMQEFFRGSEGREMAKRLSWTGESDGVRVIRFEGQLWFATLGWMTNSGKENGFAGVRVVTVACKGKKAQTGYPSWQKGGDYEDVTDWFWQQYREGGIFAIPEVWGIPRPSQKFTHAEKHTI